MPTTSPRLDRVPFIAAFVSDLKQSKRFYDTVLQLERAEFPLSAGVGEAQSYAVQGTTLLLIQSSATNAGPADPQPAMGRNVPALGPGRAYFSFGVAHLDPYHKSLVQQGVRVVQEPAQEPFGKFAVYADPDGLMFSVVEVAPEEEKHAVVFSGGGAVAAFEVGVLEGLASTAQEQNVPYILTGTSAGAFNAAYLASLHAGKLADAAKKLSDVWIKRIAGPRYDNGVMRIRANPEPLFHPSYLLQHPAAQFRHIAEDSTHLARQGLVRFGNLFTGKETFSRRVAELLDASDFISAEPLRKLVEETINPKDLLNTTSKFQLRIVATDWKSGRSRVFYNRMVGDPRPGRDIQITESNAREAVLASAAIPALFPPVKVGGELLVDGGVVMNTPLEPAIAAGATHIHLISLNPDPSEMKLSGLRDTLEEVERTFGSALAANVRGDLKTVKFINTVAGVARNPRTGKMYRAITVHRYHPKSTDIGGLGGLLDFSESHIKKLIDDGREAVARHSHANGCTEAQCALVDIPVFGH
jgi:predicted acylesterase/phospholipase RssA/catechol 2,3-dioxygenase-like lactoylglutathione lyase family enzyme